MPDLFLFGRLFLKNPTKPYQTPPPNRGPGDVHPGPWRPLMECCCFRNGLPSPWCQICRATGVVDGHLDPDVPSPPPLWNLAAKRRVREVFGSPQSLEEADRLKSALNSLDKIEADVLLAPVVYLGTAREIHINWNGSSGQYFHLKFHAAGAFGWKLAANHKPPERFNPDASDGTDVLRAGIGVLFDLFHCFTPDEIVAGV